ncbi:MAG: TAT-variant-translocated molybdopterin oxidoreductase [Verrucomicrobiota bacterium]
MKRKWEHPENSQNGKQYWRSLGELSDTPQFREWLEREFPAGAQEMEMNDISRRSFLRLMGGSLALAGLGMAGCRRPEGYIVPFTNSPEWIVPGNKTLYATAMPRRRGAVALHATTYEGRPTKLDGNALTGSTSADGHVQASILDLYDPDRSRFFKKSGKKVDGKAFADFIEEVSKNYASTQGEGLAFLTESSTSPTLQRLRTEFKGKFSKALVAAYEPISTDAELKATEIAFGQRSQINPAYAKADVIFALDCDFSSKDESGVDAAKEFASRRRVRKSGDMMNRLYVAESRITSTGGNADHRIRMKASKQPAFLALIAKEMVGRGAPDLQGAISAITANVSFTEVEQRWAREMTIDLMQSGKGLVVVGSQQPVAVHLLAIAVNQALNAYRNGIVQVTTPVQIPAASLTDLISAIKAGSVKTLFIIGGNPVYNAPVDVDWANLQKSVEQVIRIGAYEDETTNAKADWIAPLAHYLETWGDARAVDGTYLALQPMILPLFSGVSELQVFAALLGQKECLLPLPTIEPAKVAAPTLPGQPSNLPIPPDMLVVQKTFVEVTKSNNWNKLLHDGFWSGTAFSATSGAYRSSNVADGIKQNFPAYQEGLEVTFFACPKLDDGRYANNGWLQELPDVQSKLTWDNAAYVSYTTARRLGLKIAEIRPITVALDPTEVKRRDENPTLEIDGDEADVVIIKVDGRSLEIPIYVMPGQADDSIAIALGYGRDFNGYIGHQVGSNAFSIRTSANPFVAQNVEISRAGKTYNLAQTQHHFSMEGRAIVRELSLEEFTKNASIVHKMGIDGHQPEDMRSLYEIEKGTGHRPEMKDPHQWGMVIDLTTCIGCTACVIACQSENNIPIVGKDQVRRGRSMHWMRIDRYYSESPTDPQMAVQPMLCQHCENAPCETVCPVNATIHTEDGLNIMAYNRCIGTRYCANNCPYKVRRFNFFDYNKRKVNKKHKLLGFDIGNLYFGPFGEQNDDKMLEMQKNPNVTVRMRGVMEKCTFCVQRIEEAKISAIRLSKGTEKQRIATDSFKSACQQACPSEAIVFGDIANPETEVSKLRALDHNYGVLSYLGTKPRVTYLARVRNPTPLMPDADKVGLGSDWDKQSHLGSHGHGHGEEHGAHSNESAHH